MSLVYFQVRRVNVDAFHLFIDSNARKTNNAFAI